MTEIRKSQQYTSGEYFAAKDRHAEDADFKLRYTESLLQDLPIKTVADVGCGSGAIAMGLAKRFEVTGYDVSPHV